MKAILYLIVLIPIGLFAQAEIGIEPRNENYITTDLLSPFFINSGSYLTPRFRFGYIDNLNENTKIGIDIGYGSANSSLINTGDRYVLWEVRPEYYRILNPHKKTLKYVSLEIFYMNQKEVFTTQSLLNKEYEYLSFDRANYKRQKFGLIPKFGIFINISERIGLNWYIGVGLNYRRNDYDNFENLMLEPFDEEHFPPYYRNEGNRIGAEFKLQPMNLYICKLGC